MHTNMMLALVALTIVMLVTPAAASTPAPPTTPAPPLPCDFQNSTACSLVLKCTWNTDDNKCEIYVSSDDVTFYVVLALVITLVVVCKCGGLVCLCMRKDDKKVEDQQTPQEGVDKHTLQEVVVQQPPQEQEVVVKETPQANANPY